jgi:YfiH family protein
MMPFELRRINDWSYYYLPRLEKEGIVQGFFTKKSPSHTFPGKERTAFLETFSLQDLIIMDQEHGDEVHVVKNSERPVKGDGVILVERDVAAIIKTADCLPVVLVEPDYPMAAIVHAGWRGTAQKITQKAVEKMVILGARREKMFALFGPSIRSCCYEVGEEVHDIFREKGFSERVFKRENDSFNLDLRQANMELLTAESIDQVYDTGLCTFCRNDIFASYRKGERSIRQINFVSLKG